MSGYYWKSELMCATFALRELERKLPGDFGNPGTMPEWGTTIFRWESDDPVDPGWKYSYQPIYTNNDSDHWRPVGRVPSFSREWAVCHTHPNDGFFSNVDLETARGERGLVKMKLNMYMVNKVGAYRYQTIPEDVVKYMSRNDQFMKLWGHWPSSK